MARRCVCVCVRAHKFPEGRSDLIWTKENETQYTQRKEAKSHQIEKWRERICVFVGRCEKDRVDFNSERARTGSDIFQSQNQINNSILDGLWVSIFAKMVNSLCVSSSICLLWLWRKLFTPKIKKDEEKLFDGIGHPFMLHVNSEHANTKLVWHISLLFIVVVIVSFLIFLPQTRIFKLDFHRQSHSFPFHLSLSRKQPVTDISVREAHKVHVYVVHSCFRTNEFLGELKRYDDDVGE